MIDPSKLADRVHLILLRVFFWYGAVTVVIALVMTFYSPPMILLCLGQVAFTGAWWYLLRREKKTVWFWTRS